MSVIQEVVGGREEDELYIECSADIVGVPPEVIIIETLQIFKSQPGKNGISLIKQSNQVGGFNLSEVKLVNLFNSLKIDTYDESV